MNDNIKNEARTLVPLVINDGTRQLGTLAEITATAQTVTAAASCKLSFRGGSFSRQTVKHYRKELLPILDDICGLCNMGYFKVSVSVVNIQAAAMNNTLVHIDGFSADVSVFVAMLSAIFGIDVPGDIIFSGVVSKGVILPVASLAVKLQTAEAGGIKKFYAGKLEDKDSLELINAEELAAADNAIRSHRQRRIMQIKCVGSISELFDDIFDDYDFLLASLNAGVFNKKIIVSSTTPTAMIAKKICSMDIDKFRSILSMLTPAKKFEQVYFLWEKYLLLHIHTGCYPFGCGQLCHDWMCSIPPGLRNKIRTPFVSMEFFARLSQLAGQNDYHDLGLFLDCIRGKFLKPLVPVPAGGNENEVLDGRAMFNSVVSEINGRYLDQHIGIKIDSARASFLLSSSTVKNYADFLELAEAFYLHLCRFIPEEPSLKSFFGSGSDGVYELIDCAFANKGGFAEARCRALDGSNGGLRSVLDELTAHIKRQVYTRHVNAVFKKAIDIKDDKQKKAFVAGALSYLRPVLPPELVNRPAESLLEHTEVLARLYVKMIDTVRYIMSRL